MQRRSVLFPEPLEPIILMTSPAFARKVIPFSTSLLPYFLCRSSTMSLSMRAGVQELQELPNEEHSPGIAAILISWKYGLEFCLLALCEPVLLVRNLPEGYRRGHWAEAARHARGKVEGASAFGLVLGRHRHVGLLGNAALAVALEIVLDDALVLLAGDRPFLVGDRYGLLRCERDREHELAALHRTHSASETQEAYSGLAVIAATPGC
jgi:hypothetical protein